MERNKIKCLAGLSSIPSMYLADLAEVHDLVTLPELE